MANDKGMSEDKRARLEAIRAANAAKKAQEGGEPPAPAAATIVDAPAEVVPIAATTTAPAAVGASMSDEKKAKLEAIRAANAAKKGQAEPAPVAAAVAAPAAAPAARPVAAPAATAPRPAPAAARPAPKATVVEDERIPISLHLRRAAIGAVLGLILCVLLATMTGDFLEAAIWGIVLGALGGLLVMNWPPTRTTGE